MNTLANLEFLISAKDIIYSINSELLKQKVLENKKSAYGDSFRKISETDTKARMS